MFGIPFVTDWHLIARKSVCCEACNDGRNFLITKHVVQSAHTFKPVHSHTHTTHIACQGGIFATLHRRSTQHIRMVCVLTKRRIIFTFACFGCTHRGPTQSDSLRWRHNTTVFSWASLSTRAILAEDHHHHQQQRLRIANIKKVIKICQNLLFNVYTNTRSTYHAVLKLVVHSWWSAGCIERELRHGYNGQIEECLPASGFIFIYSFRESCQPNNKNKIVRCGGEWCALLNAHSNIKFHSVR